MQSSKYCPKCGKQNTILLSNNLGKPFTLENRPSLPRRDSLHAGIKYHGTGPLFSPGICDDCGNFFALGELDPRVKFPKSEGVSYTVSLDLNFDKILQETLDKIENTSKSDSNTPN